MRKISKVVSMVLAVSLLSATPAWAAKKERKSEQTVSKSIKQSNVPTKSSSKAVKKSISPTKLPAEMKSALRKIYTVLPELKELDVERVAILSSSMEYPESWEFRFEKRMKESKRTIYASVDYLPETGQIISYYINNPEWEIEKPISEEEAKEKADQFLKKLLGSGKKDYQFLRVSRYIEWDDDDEDDDDEGDDDEEDEDQFRRVFLEYQLFINELPVQDFTLELLMDGEGHILHYENTRPEKISKSKFPSLKKAMTKEKAEELFLDKLDMKLEYYFYPYDDDYGPHLVYAPSYTMPINAVTGKETDITFRTESKPERIEVSGEGKEFVARSRQEAEQVLTHLGIDVSKLEYEDEDDEEDEDEELIVYRWYYDDEDQDGSISLWVDKRTGKIDRFSHRHYDEEESQPVSKKEALETAIQGLQTFLPRGTEELQLTDVEGPFPEYNIPSWVDEDQLPEEVNDPEEDDYSFYFDDVHDDIPVIARGYVVEVDAATGTLSSLELYPADLDSLPYKDEAISPREAAETYIKQNPIQLFYVWPQFFGQKAPAPTLVYDIDDANFIDAASTAKSARKKK